MRLFNEVIFMIIGHSKFFSTSLYFKQKSQFDGITAILGEGYTQIGDKFWEKICPFYYWRNIPQKIKKSPKFL